MSSCIICERVPETAGVYIIEIKSIFRRTSINSSFVRFRANSRISGSFLIVDAKLLYLLLRGKVFSCAAKTRAPVDLLFLTLLISTSEGLRARGMEELLTKLKPLHWRVMTHLKQRTIYQTYAGKRKRTSRW